MKSTTVCPDDGLRRQRTLNSVTNNITYDEVAALLETSTTGTLNARYTNYPGGWGGLASQNRGGTSSYYGCDSQTSVRILVSSTGSITDSYSSKAFGEPLENGSGTTNPYRYDGLVLYYYELTDVMNAWNRWPRPSTGQWRSADPEGYAAGSDTVFSYVDNAPLTKFDPAGLWALPVPIDEPDPLPEGPWPYTPVNPLPFNDSTPFNPIGIQNFGPRRSTRPYLKPCPDDLAGTLYRFSCDSWPQGPCDFGQRMYPFPGEGEGVRGAVMCCNKERYSCEFMWPNEVSRPGGLIIRACLIEHENVHRANLTVACPPGGTGWLPNPSGTYKEHPYNSSECAAYEAQMKCLGLYFGLCHVSVGPGVRSGVKGVIDRAACRRNVLRELADVCAKLRKNCGPGRFGVPEDCNDLLKRLRRTWNLF